MSIYRLTLEYKTSGKLFINILENVMLNIVKAL